MDNIRGALDSVASKLSDENYEQSFAFYRCWFDIGQTYHQIPSDLALDTILLNNKATGSIDANRGELIHTTAHLIVRFAGDAESDRILAPHNTGLQSRLSATILLEFFSTNLGCVRGAETGSWDSGAYFHTNANLIAHWANLGFVEEAAIHDHILQSLISHPKLYDHQANALIILFKLAGATFKAYADPSVVDRCFKLLKDQYSRDPMRGKLVQVRTLPIVKGSRRAQTNV
jgi:hypothetical protein